MNIYYIVPNLKYIEKYNFLNINKSEKSISEIQKEIQTIPDFCRDQQSIATSELKGYLVSGISFFIENSNKDITGLANFDINQERINILGICIPKNNKGNGTIIINEIKKFGQINNLKEIKLNCYGEVKNFYEKLGFKIINEILLYNSDDEDTEEDEQGNKIRYEMLFKIKPEYGGKKNKSFKKRSSKKKKNVKKRKIFNKTLKK